MAGANLNTLKWLRAQAPPCPCHVVECLELLRGELDDADDVDSAGHGAHLRGLRDDGHPDYFALLSWMEQEAERQGGEANEEG